MILTDMQASPSKRELGKNTFDDLTTIIER